MTNRTKRGITIAIASVLLIHFLLCLLLLIDKRLLGSSLPAKIYTRLVHLGPFFRDGSIQSTPSLVMTEWDGGKVRTEDLLRRHFSVYRDQPWRTDALLHRDYLRRFSTYLARRSAQPDSTRLEKVVELIRPEMSPTSDSAAFTFTVRYFNPQSGTFRVDSFYSYQLKP